MSEANAPARALILLGAPGSGKGTQAKLIQGILGIPHVSTGDMLRERMQSSDPLGEAIRRRVESGELVTDDLVNCMVLDRIMRPDCGRGFILDGYPRTLGQAEKICQSLTGMGLGWVVIHLKVDYNEIIRRLAGRRTCSVCGVVFNLASNPPKAADQCDGCGSRLAEREDDQDRVVRKRLAAYDAQSRPVLEFFSGSSGAFHELDGGNHVPAEIARKICDLV